MSKGIHTFFLSGRIYRVMVFTSIKYIYKWNIKLKESTCLHQSKQYVSWQGSFMCLIHHHNTNSKYNKKRFSKPVELTKSKPWIRHQKNSSPVACQIWFAKKFTQEHSIGHIFQNSLIWCAIFKTNGVANLKITWKPFAVKRYLIDDYYHF